MELHPVPQNIMQVEFQLFGDLTIREFSYIAGGGLLAFVVYAVNPPFLFKWPFIILFVLGGIALAKFKYNERSLDVYAITFINALTTSQKMVWKKGPKKSDILADQKSKPVSFEFSATSAARAQQGSSGIGAVKAFQQVDYDVDSADAAIANRVDSLFDAMYAQKTQGLPSGQKMQFMPKKGDDVQVKLKPLSTYSSYNVLGLAASGEKLLVLFLSGRQGATIKSKAGVYGDVVEDDLERTQKEVNKKESDLRKKLMGGKDVFKRQKDPQFSETTNATMVTASNIISGFVKDYEEKLQGNAIIMIKDKDTERNVRTMLTNSLGYFSHTTPLKNGEYTINIYKDKLKFDPIEIHLSGETVKPLVIIAQG